MKKNNSEDNFNLNLPIESLKIVSGNTQKLIHPINQKFTTDSNSEQAKSKNSLKSYQNLPDLKKNGSSEAILGMDQDLPSLKNTSGSTMLYKDYPSYSSSITNTTTTTTTATNNSNREKKIISIDSSRINQSRSKLLSPVNVEKQNHNIMVNLKTLSKKELKNMINIHATKPNILKNDYQHNIGNHRDTESSSSPDINMNKKHKPPFFASEGIQFFEKNDENKVASIATSIIGQPINSSESIQSPLILGESLSPLKLYSGRSNGMAILSVPNLTLRTNCNENTEEKLGSAFNIQMLMKRANHIRDLNEDFYSKTSNHFLFY